MSTTSNPNPTPFTPTSVNIYGDPTRMFSLYTMAPPLDVDALLATGPLPTSFAPTFPESAFETDPSQIACNDQKWVDWQGIVSALNGWYASGNKLPPTAYKFQQWINYMGDPIIYKGQLIAPNGQWMP
jgi:hypothetical protein